MKPGKMMSGGCIRLDKHLKCLLGIDQEVDIIRKDKIFKK
jgi:hypothetical protein